MKAKKVYKVVATTTYQGKTREYVVGTFTNKRDANRCLDSQYTTITRTFDVVIENI